jgi:hypothetical protein
MRGWDLSWQADLPFRDEAPAEQAKKKQIIARCFSEGQLLGSDGSIELPGRHTARREALTVALSCWESFVTGRQKRLTL